MNDKIYTVLIGIGGGRRISLGQRPLGQQSHRANS